MLRCAKLTYYVSKWRWARAKLGWSTLTWGVEVHVQQFCRQIVHSALWMFAVRQKLGRHWIVGGKILTKGPDKRLKSTSNSCLFASALDQQYVSLNLVRFSGRNFQSIFSYFLDKKFSQDVSEKLRCNKIVCFLQSFGRDGVFHRYFNQFLFFLHESIFWMAKPYFLICVTDPLFQWSYR